jgi:hypothetical protein
MASYSYCFESLTVSVIENVWKKIGAEPEHEELDDGEEIRIPDDPAAELENCSAFQKISYCWMWLDNIQKRIDGLLSDMIVGDQSEFPDKNNWLQDWIQASIKIEEIFQ